jgi:hypothetical protein
VNGCKLQNWNHFWCWTFEVTLRLTVGRSVGQSVSQSVCLGIEHLVGFATRYYFLSECRRLKFASRFCGAPSLTRGRVSISHQITYSQEPLALYSNQRATNSMALVREQTIRPSDRRLSAKLVPTFADRGCRVVSAPNPRARILRFLDRSRYCTLDHRSCEQRVNYRIEKKMYLRI